MSWMTSPACSPAGDEPLLRFLLLSPCPQRLLFAAADLAFLLVLLPRFFRQAPGPDPGRDPLLPKPETRARAGPRFAIALAASLLLAAAYAALAAAKLGLSSGFTADELLFLLARFIANSAAAAVVYRERAHPTPLRIYWAASFLLSSLLAASAAVRLAGGAAMIADDVAAIAVLPLSIALLYISISGSTGLSAGPGPGPGPARPVTAYAGASLISLASWSWMNPLLAKGYASALNVGDIPGLAPQHEARRMHELFEAHWPKPAARSRRPVPATLLKCFWPGLLLTGALSLAKLAVMYVGPSLVNSFVTFASSENRDPMKGLQLCGTLLVAKILEVLTSHHYNFVSGNLGMMIRTALITALYKKGLRLSCSSRQKHGVGMIVNYMAVDAQQLADMMLQIHFLWMMPTQVTVALALLYMYLGVAVSAAVVGMMLTLGLVMWTTRKSNMFQFLLMTMRDKRMKAVNETLNFMRVIKFQAWEEIFSRRINEYRAGEFEWLSKFLYAFSANMSALSSSGSVISALAFGTCVIIGFPLTAGVVFTATSFFRLLSEPLRTFPQALISCSQAIVSIERLDSYLTAPELDENAVERVEGCGDGVAVEVRDGSFTWSDDVDDCGPTLKNLNLEVRQGELAAVVGTVGSGKSSLLSCLLGEMNKISGKLVHDIWRKPRYQLE